MISKTLLDQAAKENARLERPDDEAGYDMSRYCGFIDGALWREQQPITEEQFKQYVVRELDSCGYFMADCDQELMKRINPDWKPYSSKSFGEMLLDFACQWNMEHEGKNYEYKLVEDDPLPCIDLNEDGTCNYCRSKYGRTIHCGNVTCSRKANLKEN